MDFPQSISFTITNACNLHCAHGISSVLLRGGEVFLFTDIVELLDYIQPNGDANFCVDFPDYVIGNVKEATIEELWNGERAARFREYRREKPLAVCYRCGAKYMSEIE